MEMIALEEIIIFHEKIIEKTGGSQGIRDIGLIESAINRPFQTYDGIELYPEIESKISAITYSLINNHGFVDGNKRIGVSVMLLLLKLNDIKIEYKQEELVDLGIKIAENKYKEEDIKKWIESHSL